MTNGNEQAPAGWYNDPHAPERMRYFDGEMWTNHFHEPGKLPDIGSWLSTTFRVFSNYWQGAAIIALIVHLAGSLVIWGGLWFAVRDVAIVNENIENFTLGTGIVIGVIAILGIFVQGFGWLAMSRYLHRAHFQANPTVADAFTHALQRLPRYLGVMAIVIGVFLVVVFVLAGVTVAVPGLGIFLFLLAIPIGVWVAVKLAFVINAVAIAPRDVSAIGASAEVSNGRFWPVLGRVFLFSLVLGVIAQMLAAALGQFGQVIDPDALAENIQAQGDTVIVNDFVFTALLPSTGQFLVALVISSIIQGASALLSTSAFVRLYLDSGAPSDAL